MLATGQQSFYKIEFFQDQKRIQRVDNMLLNCSPYYKSVQVGDTIWKIQSEGMKAFKLSGWHDITCLEVIQRTGYGPVQMDKGYPLILGSAESGKSVTRFEFALTCYKQRFIVASGGYHHHTALEVFSFDTKAPEETKTKEETKAKDDTKAKDKVKKWRRTGAMNKPRSHHGSCVLKDCVYFFAGLDENQMRLNTIEWLNMETGDKVDAPLVPPEQAGIVPREHPCFGPISDTKIAIMGGRGAFGKLNDVHIFDVEADPKVEAEYNAKIRELSHQVDLAVEIQQLANEALK